MWECAFARVCSCVDVFCFSLLFLLLNKTANPLPITVNLTWSSHVCEYFTQPSKKMNKCTENKKIKMQMMITIKYSSRGAQIKLLLFLSLIGLIFLISLLYWLITKCLKRWIRFCKEGFRGKTIINIIPVVRHINIFSFCWKFFTWNATACCYLYLQIIPPTTIWSGSRFFSNTIWTLSPFSAYCAARKGQIDWVHHGCSAE